MKISKIYALIALTTVANHALADNYTNEASIGISNGDVESAGFSADAESVDLSFVANFSEVDTSKGPLAEASFLDRTSSFSIGYSDGEVGIVDTTDLSLGLRVVGKENGLTGEILFSDGEVQDIDTETIALSVGYYVAKNTELSLAYIDVEVEDTNSDSLFLGVKHVSSGDLAFSIEAAVGTVETGTDDDTAFVLGGTFYPSSHVGIGANYTTIDSALDNDSYEIFVDWFITPVAAITLSYSDSEIADIESDSINFSTRFRF